ncbi:MAG: hypothetical protein IKX76_05850 [Eubacterium sp.]|nr:hypothetical protein [Eubacterium sp.]
MRYEEFKEAFTKEMMDALSRSGIDVTPQEVPKVNQTLDALCFRRQDENAAVLFYVKDAYEQYENGQSMEGLVADVRQFIGDRIKEAPKITDINHDYIREHLYLTVVNAGMNRDYLSDIPHEILEDMAVVPRVKVSEEASFAVKNDMLEHYGFSKQDLLQAAHANMDQMEFTCRDLGSVLFGYGVPMDMPPSPSESIYVLTNPSGIDGTAAILSDKAMQEARNMIGEDFLILPSSRHEVLLVPRSMDMSVRELAEMVREVNRTAVDEKDLLSDHVYRYNSRSGAIKMLEPKADVLEKKQSLPPVLM